MSGTATVYAPLRVERAALRGAPATLRVVRTGMGPARAMASRVGSGPILVAGLGGGLAPGVRPGDIVVASEVRAGKAIVACPSAPLLAGALRRQGLRVHVGPTMSSARVVRGHPGASGTAEALAVALAVDMESAWLAPSDEPFAVLRAIVDTPDHPLWRFGTAARGVAGLRVLRRTLPALHQWAAATGARELVLVSPQFCAGVERAIEVVGHATANRQRAVTAIAREADLVLVLGSENSSNSRRLVEVAAREGVPAHLVDDVDQVDLRWLAGARRVAITAGAIGAAPAMGTAAPPRLVDELVRSLAGLGPVTVRDTDIRFTLPTEVS